LLARAGLSTNIEWLDEPTKHLSDEGVEDLLELLKERAVETGRSIYFVDHHLLDKGLFNSTIFIEKNENCSRIIEQ
jgi:ABC-type transport system involved in cytochrome bd biosynthesis fused ATPase/permease subunit